MWDILTAARQRAVIWKRTRRRFPEENELHILVSNTNMDGRNWKASWERQREAYRLTTNKGFILCWDKEQADPHPEGPWSVD